MYSSFPRSTFFSSSYHRTVSRVRFIVSYCLGCFVSPCTSGFATAHPFSCHLHEVGSEFLGCFRTRKFDQGRIPGGGHGSAETFPWVPTASASTCIRRPGNERWHRTHTEWRGSAVWNWCIETLHGWMERAHPARRVGVETWHERKRCVPRARLVFDSTRHERKKGAHGRETQCLRCMVDVQRSTSPIQCKCLRACWYPRWCQFRLSTKPSETKTSWTEGERAHLHIRRWPWSRGPTVRRSRMVADGGIERPSDAHVSTRGRRSSRRSKTCWNVPAYLCSWIFTPRGADRAK
mmetsp:Transcript_904/g.5686  ORF Transcript_904/g.5686 Transcript_904/m.5686 type:complete len:292 (+) Transcript_904:4173-5048(+)